MPAQRFLLHGFNRCAARASIRKLRNMTQPPLLRPSKEASRLLLNWAHSPRLPKELENRPNVCKDLQLDRFSSFFHEIRPSGPDTLQRRGLRFLFEARHFLDFHQSEGLFGISCPNKIQAGVVDGNAFVGSPFITA